jgi:formylglycine-generating enzyme
MAVQFGYVETATSCELSECTGGRIRVTDGVHCCWPEQTWASSPSARPACVGVPVCPARATAHGETCYLPFADPVPMVAIPGGSFAMGESHRKVTVAHFSLDTTEVTVGSYAACVASERCSVASLGNFCNAGKPGNEAHPINCVDWNQAVAYCAATGKRLPTEEEWEWAARGGERGWTYAWGDDPPGDQFCGARSRERGTRPTCPAVDVSREAVQGGVSGAHRSGKSASSCSSVVASRIRGRTSVRYSVGSTPFAMHDPTSE